MIKQRYGKIVNISGTSGLRGYKYRAAYSSSKWALRGFTRTVALEAGPHDINVNALHPGIVGGDRMDKLCREKAQEARLDAGAGVRGVRGRDGAPPRDDRAGHRQCRALLGVATTRRT